MKRNAIKISENKHRTVQIFADDQVASKVLPYLLDDSKILKEFQKIQNVLHNNLRNKDLYLKVQNTGSIYEMRFQLSTGSGKKNDRIYCKELHAGKRRLIIMVEVYFGKKQNAIPKQLKDKLRKIDTTYDYDTKTHK